MEKSKRLTYLDMAKGIGIILVVIGHIVITDQRVMIWLSSFHMPLFFMISGITLALKPASGETKSRIAARFRGIVIPYIWFSALYFIVDIGNLYRGTIDADQFRFNAISSVTFYGKSVMWFLTALFISQVLFIIMQGKLNDKLIIASTVILAAAAYFASLGLTALFNAHSTELLITTLINMGRTVVRACVVLPFLVFGYYLHRGIDGFKHKDNRLLMLGAGIVLLILDILICFKNGIVDTNNILIANPPLYYAGGICGSLSILCICKALPDIAPLTCVGRNSLVIMAVHLDFYVLWAGLKVGMFVYGKIQADWVMIAVAVVVTLMIGSAAAYVIDRFFPFILGKKVRKKSLDENSDDGR